MSRFNNPKAVLTPPRSRPGPIQKPDPGKNREPVSAGPSPPKSAIAPAITTEPRPDPALRSLILEPSASDSSMGQRLGLGLLCIFFMSSYANDFAVQLFAGKAYISTVAFAVLPAMLLISGNLLRGLRDITGRMWLLFIIWVCLAVPFSVWKGGSVSLLMAYVPHSWIQLFYFAAFAISVKHVRQLMFFLIAADFLLLLDCFFFGSMETGRLEIPRSMFFSNANDLALHLTIAITQFMYLLHERQFWKHILAFGAMLVAGVFLLKTGSRGDFLAVSVLAVVCFIFANPQQRLRFVVIGVPLLAGALLLVPSESLHRLMLIVEQDQGVVDASDSSSMSSQAQRITLLKTSIEFAVTHPVFGVGPGQFAVAMSGDLAKDGKNSPWLGTHNSYTEVASECGIPALFLYTGVLMITLVSSFRIYRRTVHIPALNQVNALAFCLFSGALMYSICTMFFHIAYTGILPALAGMSLALRLSISPVLWQRTPEKRVRRFVRMDGLSSAGLNSAGMNPGAAPAR